MKPLVPDSGAGGESWATTARRQVLIHIDNSKPILDKASEQRGVLDGHGLEVAYDGLEITP